MRILSFGLIDGRAVFMDDRTDSYFMLDAETEGRLHRLLDLGQKLTSDAGLLAALGIAGEEVDLRPARYPAPTKSLPACASKPRTRVSDIVRAATLVHRTSALLRRRPIESLLERIAAPAGAIAPEPGGLAEHACRFLTARKLVPRARNCLLDSLSLLEWLGPRGEPLALLFGAKLDPFAAHCWVQSGDRVLNDHLESVAAFVPVRVIQCSEATP